MRAYEKIMDKCEILLGEKYKELAEIESRIDEKETRRRELLRKLDFIKASGTFGEYTDARTEIESLDYEIKRLQEWKANVEKNKLITSEEYESLLQEATAEACAETEKLNAEIIKLAEEFYRKGSELRALITNTNQSFQHLQNDVYKNEDQPKDKNGDPVSLIGRRVLPSDLWETVNWATSLAESYQYEKYTGKKIQEGE